MSVSWIAKQRKQMKLLHLLKMTGNITYGDILKLTAQGKTLYYMTQVLKGSV